MKKITIVINQGAVQDVVFEGHTQDVVIEIHDFDVHDEGEDTELDIRHDDSGDAYQVMTFTGKSD